MRPNHVRAGALAGSLGFAFTCAASLPAAAHADNPGSTPTMHVSDRTLTVGHNATVSGRVDPAYAGRAAVLEFRAAGTAQYAALAASPVARDGRYRIRHSVPRSGALRVTIQAPAGAATAAAAQSSEVAVSVASSLGVSRRRLHVRAGGSTLVAGTVRPGAPGLPVTLQLRGRHGWRTLDRGRTGNAGRYVLRDRERATLSAPLRVVVAPHDGLVKARVRVGRLNVYRVANASWYGPGLYGGHLACGGTLEPGTLGVANKYLPCGAKVTLRYGGRSIRVPVIDRGPYVAGRDYDLTQATAQRLGFSGHGAILATR
jgi:hypothetical protein